MSITKRALELAEDIASMWEYQSEDLNTGSYAVEEFVFWAINQHEKHTCDTIGIDMAGLKDLMTMFYEYDSRCSKEEPEYTNSYQEIAIALFRYYLQSYKAKFDLTPQQLQELGYINTLKVAA